MKSIMEKDRPSSALWRNNNSHIIENQCGLGIGGSMVKEALPVGSMLIAQFVITICIICKICNYNFEFWFFYISHHRKSMRAGDWGNMVKEAMGFKARWFTIVVCLTALHSIVAQCWLLLLSSSSQSLWHVLEEFASFWSKLMIHHCSWSCQVTSSQESSLF